MKEKYQNSKRHKENIRNARIKGLEQRKLKQQERIQEYFNNPKLCLYCSSPIEYKCKNIKKFCCKSCSAKYNNSNRLPRTEESKSKVSESLKLFSRSKNSYIITKICIVCGDKFNTYKYKENKKVCNKCKRSKNSLPIKVKNCIICQREFETKYNKKTCSEVCKTKLIFQKRKFQNGRQKLVKYINKIQGEVQLESSWELKIAEYLDKKNINWIRPNPILWIDSNNKNHLYYPDFYLIDFNIYLDPKNPYCMKLDEEKLKIVCTKVKLYYGNVDEIINKLNIFL